LRRASWGEFAILAAATVAGAIGLTCFGLHVMSPHAALGAGEHSADGTLVDSEVVAILVPSAFRELAECPPDDLTFESPDALKAYLRARRLEKAWYAIIARGFQADGTAVSLSSYCHPFHCPTRSEEFRQVLATLAGDPPRGPDADYARAEVRFIPQAFVECEPSQALLELLAHWESAALGR
jgi:hypothetical protein